MTDQQASGQFDVLVVGAGFAGLYAIYPLRQQGLSVRALEAGSDVGGTWYWNRYPGCRCDVESMEYSFSFSEALQQDWDWSERYATAAEIQTYARHVARRFDLRRHIDFDTRVVSAAYDGETGGWQVVTAQGRSLQARFLVMATGVLSAGRIPEFDGLDRFRGGTYHTSTWPFDAPDFTGKSVAILGAGSSGVQAIPELAKQAGHLYVLLRTPNYVVPARNGPLAAAEMAKIRALYPELRAKARSMRGAILLPLRDQSALEVTEAERQAEFERRWQMGGAFNFTSAFNDVQSDPKVNRIASDFIRAKISAAVNDPATARALQPPHLVGTRRLCVGTEFYETFNRANVTLVNLNETPLLGFTETGARVGDGDIALDAMVFATGFDAITGALSKIDIRGRDAVRLQEVWQQGATSLIGMMSAGFPNLFMVGGPGSPAVLTNVIMSIEHHVDWISGCIDWLRMKGLKTIEATPEAQKAWAEHVAEVGAMALSSQGNAWYLGANVPGKPKLFLPYAGGFPQYVARVKDMTANGYAGFATTRD